MHNTKLSIIVPVYRVEQYIEECLDSILMQDYPNFELILVDDGSPDNCPEICDRYAGQDSRIKVIHQENRGLAEARNRGLSIVTGDYVIFIDSDDSIRQGYFSAIAAVINNSQSEIDIVFIPFEKKVRDVFTKNSYHGDDIRNDVLINFIGNSKLKEPLWSMVCQISIRYELVKDMTFPSIYGMEDKPYFIETLLRANNFYIVDGYYYIYRVNETSITKTNEGARLVKTFYEGNHATWLVLKKYGMDTPVIKRAYENTLLFIYMLLYKLSVNNCPEIPAHSEMGEEFGRLVGIDNILTTKRVLKLSVGHGYKWFLLKFSKKKLLKIYWNKYAEKG